MNLVAIHSFLASNCGKYSFPDGSLVNPIGGSEWYWWRPGGVEGVCFTLEAALLRACGKSLLPAVDVKDATVEHLQTAQRLYLDMKGEERVILGAFITSYWNTRPRGLLSACTIRALMDCMCYDRIGSAEMRQNLARSSSALQQYIRKVQPEIEAMKTSSGYEDDERAATARAHYRQLEVQ